MFNVFFRIITVENLLKKLIFRVIFIKMPEHLDEIQNSIFNLTQGEWVQLTSLILILIYLVWRFKK